MQWDYKCLNKLAAKIAKVCCAVPLGYFCLIYQTLPHTRLCSLDIKYFGEVVLRPSPAAPGEQLPTPRLLPLVTPHTHGRRGLFITDDARETMQYERSHVHTAELI